MLLVSAYNMVNQPYVCIYHLPLDAPSQPIPLPLPLGHHRAPSWVPCAVQGLATSYFTQGSVHVSVLPPQFVPPSPSPLCPQVHSLHLASPSYPANRFICTIFLDSIYVVVLLLSHVSLRPHAGQRSHWGSSQPGIEPVSLASPALAGEFIALYLFMNILFCFNDVFLCLCHWHTTLIAVNQWYQALLVLQLCSFLRSFLLL